jgi:hypothetical protein
MECFRDLAGVGLVAWWELLPRTLMQIPNWPGPANIPFLRIPILGTSVSLPFAHLWDKRP